MSAQSDLIDFFQLDATFDPITRSTREVIQSSDRAQLKRQVVTVKKWKREAEPIGHGGSGIIWLEHDEDGSESRALKQVTKATSTKPLQTAYRREMQALGRLSKRQDLFVHFYGWFENDASIFLVMEYFELGDLEKFITPELTEKDAKVIGRQLLEGVQVLHGYSLAHRDLKPANILVARCGPDWWIKLGDFGISRRISTVQKSKLTRVGTPDYMAPELLLANDDEDQDSPYTLAVDIWSLGCVLFCLLTNQLPFPELRHLRLYWQSRKPFPTDILHNYSVSEDGVSFITEMMKSNPVDRMTVTTALLHSWVSNKISTPILGDLDGKLANEGPATESRKSGSVSLPKRNLEDKQSCFNTAIASHTKSRNIPLENQELLPYNSQFTSSQNNEIVQLRIPMPNREERIFDSSAEDISILESKSKLADIYLTRGNYREAMQLFELILESRRRLLGDEHPDTLRAMNDLAKSFNKLGRYQDAMNLYKQTLDVQKRILDNEHPDTLLSMFGLAASYLALGQYQEAMRLMKQTLELQKQILGNEHPDTLCSMHGLATSYSQIGQYQEAMRLEKQALELRKRILGDEHPDTFLSMFRLAASYLKLGQYQQAMHLEKQTLELRKRILGDEHPDTIRSMHSLAVSYSNLGRKEEAIHLEKQTLELRKCILGDEHPDTLRSMYILAEFYSELGQYRQEAMGLIQQTLELQKRILGDEHPDTFWSIHTLAGLYFERGQHETAILLEKQTLELRKRILGDEHPDTIWSMFGLAVFYSSLGHQEAVLLSKQAVEAQRRIFGPDHPETIFFERELARFSRYKQDSQKEKPRTNSILAISETC